jgi:hypothetical protein
MNADCTGLRFRSAFVLVLVGLLATVYGCRGGTATDDGPSQSDHAHDHDHDHDGHDHHGHDHHGHDHDHDHDHGHGTAHEPPATFEEALARLESLTQTITEACEAGDLHQAHDELHEVGHLLDGWDALITNFDIDDSKATQAKGLGEALFNRFMKLDDSLHGGDEVDLDKFAEGLKTELGKLQEIRADAAQ